MAVKCFHVVKKIFPSVKLWRKNLLNIICVSSELPVLSMHCSFYVKVLHQYTWKADPTLLITVKTIAWRYKLSVHLVAQSYKVYEFLTLWICYQRALLNGWGNLKGLQYLSSPRYSQCLFLSIILVIVCFVFRGYKQVLFFCVEVSLCFDFMLIW